VTRKLLADRRKACSEAALFMTRLGTLGLFMALHKMHEVVRSIGYEVAALETSERKKKGARGFVEYKPTKCEAGADGECHSRRCPQAKDGEPGKSGRDCPLLEEPRHKKKGARK